MRRHPKYHVQQHISSKHEFEYHFIFQIFTRKEALKEHFLCKHKGEANYQCHHCPMKFGTKSALNHHVLAQRIFNCEVCGKGLKGRHTMRYHMKTQHNAIPKGSVQCDFCVEGFLLEGLRVEHMKKKHPVEFNEKYNTPEEHPIEELSLEYEQTP